MDGPRYLPRGSHHITGNRHVVPLKHALFHSHVAFGVRRLAAATVWESAKSVILPEIVMASVRGPPCDVNRRKRSARVCSKPGQTR